MYNLKKALIILLIFSVSIIDIIRPIYLSLWQINWRKQIRKELKAEVKKNYLIKLTFCKNDLQSKKITLQFIKKDEFRYNNSMYDVVDKLESNDSLTYVCFLDLKEMIQIASIMNLKMHSGLLLPILPLLKNSSILYIYYITTKQVLFLFPSLYEVLHLPCLTNCPIRIIDVATPPPKYLYNKL